MQGLEALTAEEQELVTAEQLRELTATDEELYDRALKGLVESAMSSMVANATNQGALGYGVQILLESNGKSNEKLIEDFVKTFQDLGYTVNTNDAEISGQKVRNVNIEWNVQ